MAPGKIIKVWYYVRQLTHPGVKQRPALIIFINCPRELTYQDKRFQKYTPSSFFQELFSVFDSKYIKIYTVCYDTPSYSTSTV